MSARLSLRLADVYIQLLDLDAAAAHLARAEQLNALISSPLSLDLIEQTERIAASRGRLGEPIMVREQEYAWIYDQTVYDFIHLQFITASYRHRVGDVAGAVKCADMLKPVLDHLPENVGVLFGVTETLWIIAIYRDAKRYEDALRMLETLQGLPQAQSRRFELAYMRGLLNDMQGKSAEALDAYEQALSMAQTDGIRFGMLPYVQYSVSLLNVGRATDALNALTNVEVDRDARTAGDKLAYNTAAAWVFAANNRSADALAAAERALVAIEAIRTEIPDPTERRSWQGQQHNLFSIAVRLYTDSGDRRRAWHIVELSRARTLLDELIGRETASTEHEALMGELHAIEEAVRLIDRDIGALAAAPAGDVLRIEASARLTAALTPAFSDIVASKAFVEGNLVAIRRALIERQAQAQVRERTARERSSRPSDALLAFADVSRVLREEERRPWP